MASRQRQILLLGGLALAVLAAYSNHFGNGFHFDDSHTVVDNPAIRSLTNIPRFFSDARTFSVDPVHQSYRPLVSASLAVDYAMGHGLDPFWFHVSTFLWFLIQLMLMYRLYMYVLERACPNPQNPWLAWLAVAIYGLHPVSAETVNYIVQRGDLLATFGVVSGVVFYAWKPRLRRFGFYLLPALAGMLAKPSALIFAPILLAYIVLIDHPVRLPRKDWLISCVRLSTPAFFLSGAFWYFQKIMTPASVVYAKLSSFDYWITQPYVTLRYVRSFFLPLYLSADTDLPAFHSLWSAPVLAGFAFCALLIAAAYFTARQPKWRPVSFGLWWFLIGLIPTAVQPLQDVENDHRMFLPFVGLSLAVVWTSALLLRLHAGVPIRRFATVVLVVLAALAWGTHKRNEVWHTEESLWRDVTEKSPANPRGHYNLGVALSKSPGRSLETIQEYEAAVRMNPDYAEAQNNLGAALSDIPGRLPEAIEHFEALLRLKPDSAGAHFALATVLSKTSGRLPEAIAHYKAAVALKPDYAEAYNNLGAALAATPGRLPEAIEQYEAALRISPNSAELHNNVAVALAGSPGRLPEAISHYEAALRIKPDFMEAHYNLGLALSRAPGRLPQAISELQAAYRIRPDPALQQTLDNLRANR